MAFDLKPLTDDVIKSLNLTPAQLWLVKIDFEIYGPFEVQSLKHYALENEQLFDSATTTSLETSNWQPFFSHAHFPRPDKLTSYGNVKYWSLVNGQKLGPFNKDQIQSKVKAAEIMPSDLISLDDGHTWKKAHQLEEISSLQHSIEELPEVPTEDSFQKAKMEVEHLLDDHERKDSYKSLADLVHLGVVKNKVALKLDEIDLKSLSETEISRSLKWAIPTVAAGVCLIAYFIYFLVKPSAPEEIVEIKEAPANIAESTPASASAPAASAPAPEVKEVPQPAQITQSFAMPDLPLMPKIPAPRVYHPRRVRPPRPVFRTPAATHPSQAERSALTAAPRENEPYPTETETHQNEPENTPDPVAETDAPNPPQEKENSLVNNNQPEGDSLDQAMGNGNDPAEPPPETPAIEEAADF